MSLAAREALNKLISKADVQQFAIHAEDWSACSTTAVLAASADKLGELAEQRAYKDDVGRTRQDWRERRADLQRCLVLSRRRLSRRWVPRRRSRSRQMTSSFYEVTGLAREERPFIHWTSESRCECVRA